MRVCVCVCVCLCISVKNEWGKKGRGRELASGGGGRHGASMSAAAHNGLRPCPLPCTCHPHHPPHPPTPPTSPEINKHADATKTAAAAATLPPLPPPPHHINQGLPPPPGPPHPHGPTRLNPPNSPRTDAPTKRIRDVAVEGTQDQLQGGRRGGRPTHPAHPWVWGVSQSFQRAV